MSWLPRQEAGKKGGGWGEDMAVVEAPQQGGEQRAKSPALEEGCALASRGDSYP